MSLFCFLIVVFCWSAHPAQAGEDLSKPAAIRIEASADRVRKLIVAAYSSEEWAIDRETETSIRFSRPAGLKSRLAYGGNPRAIDQYSIIEIEAGITEITVNLSVEAARPGREGRAYNWNSDKQSRKEIRVRLEKIKAQAEQRPGLSRELGVPF